MIFITILDLDLSIINLWIGFIFSQTNKVDNPNQAFAKKASNEFAISGWTAWSKTSLGLHVKPNSSTPTHSWVCILHNPILLFSAFSVLANDLTRWQSQVFSVAKASFLTKPSHSRISCRASSFILHSLPVSLIEPPRLSH